MKVQFIAVLLALMFAGSANANQLITLRGSNYDLPAERNVGVGDIVEIRVAAISAMLGAYRLVNGTFSAPVGTYIYVVYDDGTSEVARVVSTTGSITAVSLGITGSSGGGASGGYYTSGGRLYGSGGTCLYGCGRVTVGDLEQP